MKKERLNEETIKKQIIRGSIILSIFIILCSTLPFVLTGNKIPLKLIIIAIVFMGVIIISSVIGFKFREKISKPKTQKILGYVIGGLACLQIILYLIANLLGGKISTGGLIISGIVFVCFLASGIILIKKSKKKD